MTVTKHLADPGPNTAGSIQQCCGHTHHALHICDLLEALADDLPKRSAPVWRGAQMQCRAVLHPYFAFLNEVVLPKLLRQNNRDADRREVLCRLKSDCGDQIHALSDLDDLMSDALFSDQFTNEPEALGYALRGHFEALRRDLRWQLDVLWPIAARTWTARDVARVTEALGRLNKMH